MKTLYKIFILSLLSSIIFISCDDDGIVTNDDLEKYELSFNIDYKGDKKIQHLRAVIFDYETAVDASGVPSGAPSAFTKFPKEPAVNGIDFTETKNLTLEAVKGKKYLAIIYGDVDLTDGMSNTDADPIYIIENLEIVDKDLSFDIEIKDPTEVCTPECGDKVCGDDGCGGNTCGICQTGETCSTDQLSCEVSEKTYEITLKVNYSGTKTVKRIGIAGYEADGYAGMPNYAQFVEDTITFPYTFTFDPTKDGAIQNIASDYNGDLYIWLYGDVDGAGFQATGGDPQLKFSLTLPKDDVTETIEILDID